MDLAPHRHDFDLWINWATRVTIIVPATELLSRVRVLITRHVERPNLENFGLMFKLRTSHSFHSAPSLSSDAQGLHHPPPLHHHHQQPPSPVIIVQLPPTTTASQQQRQQPHMNGRATSSRWWWWSLSTSLKVSNLNSPSFFSFHTRHSGHVSTNSKWMMSNEGQPGEPSDYPPLPFFNNGSRATLPTAMWQTTIIIQPPPTTPQQQRQCASPCHTTPNQTHSQQQQPMTAH